LSEQAFPVLMGRQRDRLEPIRQLGNHVQAARADGTSRSKYCNASHASLTSRVSDAILRTREYLGTVASRAEGVYGVRLQISDLPTIVLP
jgi:hypothetical protein